MSFNCFCVKFRNVIDLWVGWFEMSVQRNWEIISQVTHTAEKLDNSWMLSSTLRAENLDLLIVACNQRGTLQICTSQKHPLLYFNINIHT